EALGTLPGALTSRLALGLPGDAVGLAAQAVGELVGGADAGLEGLGERSTRREFVDETVGTILSPFEPGRADQGPALVAPSPPPNQVGLGRYVPVTFEPRQFELGPTEFLAQLLLPLLEPRERRLKLAPLLLQALDGLGQGDGQVLQGVQVARPSG